MDQHLVLTLALFFASFVLGYAFHRLWKIESNHPDHCNHHWEFVSYYDLNEDKNVETMPAHPNWGAGTVIRCGGKTLTDEQS
jgi:hypothetical protein